MDLASDDCFFSYKDQQIAEEQGKDITRAPVAVKQDARSTVQYRERRRKIAAKIGGHSYDGCGEFTPAGPEGSINAFKCATCGCHHSFHREEEGILRAPVAVKQDARPRVSTMQYLECQRNHAAKIGGHGYDGCGEFTPAGPEASINAFKCATCGCHRSFHREEEGILRAPVAVKQDATPRVRTVQYLECQRNHAAKIGGHSYDGCGEFTPAGPEGSINAFKCVACGCHRSFHRKEFEEGGAPCSCNMLMNTSWAPMDKTAQLQQPPTNCLHQSVCTNEGKGLQRLAAGQSDLIAHQESQIGTNYEEALSCVTTEKADEDQKIFCPILGELEDAICQFQAQNSSPSIPYDRKEDTSALEGPKSQEPLNLQRIVCSEGDGVALNMQNLKSNLEDHGSFATTVVGEIVDDSLRLCFENGETMSRMVGVGLDYAVVMVNCDYEIVVEEKSKDMWRSYVSGNETTMIERLMVRISNHIDNLEGNSSQSLDPIRMAKLLGVGIEGPGNYTNCEKKPSVSWNPIIELVKIMFWNRFQRHTMFAINAKSNDAKVQSGVHDAKIWDLEGENEDGLKNFKVPSNWWSTKWWQNIAVDDMQPNNTPINLNKESSSGKIGHQQSGDGNVQRGKDPSGASSSSDEDSKLHHQPFDKIINSHGKRKNKHGGDNNDEDDDHNNAKKTCQDGSKVELYMDEDDIMSIVCVSVKPKYGCWKPSDADLDREPANITPHLKFWFHKSTSSREIKVNTSVRFDLGDHGPILTSSRTFFGWYHDDIEVSLRSMECDSSTLKHDNKILQPLTSGKTSWRETSGSTSNPANVFAHLPVLNRPFNVGGMLSWEKGRSATHTREVEQICEMVNQQSWGGFIFKENCSGGGRPRLAYNLKHPIPIPNQVWEKSCYDLLLQCGICSTITPAIEGTWEDLNESEASPYLLEAQRVFQKRCRNKMISTGGRASNETHDDIKVEEQKYHVKLYVNHAMTHMNQFQKLTLAQNKTMEGGLINLQDDFYGKVEHGKLRQEQVA